MGALPIFGVGMPTVDGVVSVLKNVSGSTSPGASKRVHALWINMREEPVVYINGRPFVLREEVGGPCQMGSDQLFCASGVLTPMHPGVGVTESCRNAFLHACIHAL